MLVHVHYDHVEPADKSSEISSYIVVLWYNNYCHSCVRRYSMARDVLGQFY